jgi:6-phosphogluconolactonase (cycloisomerase 2 family)
MADLGTNTVFYYEFFEKELIWREEKSLKFPGSGPRSLIAG